jgi:acyl-CoA synthetase (AMP-forming)/AMP-acid ligase II/acyl carrier protein
MYPDRVAVKAADGALTYIELNTMANNLAREIIKERGNNAESVALLMENGTARMVAMLGILKVGKFFALLDPALPKPRLAATLEDSRATLLIADSKNASVARDVITRGCQLMAFVSANGVKAAEEHWPQKSPNAFACIFYTSGSTGQAKGVVWSHRNVLHQAMLFTNAYHSCTQDRISLLTTGTGSAVTNAFFALLTGATLLPFDVRREGAGRLANWLSDENVSICFIGVPLFRNLCETLTAKAKFPGLRLVWLKSESVYKTDFDLYKKYFPSRCLLINGLASSEAGFLTLCLFDHNSEIRGVELPVGYPVKDKEILLLNDMGEKVGFNAVGEIAVRSQFLSLGFWGRAHPSETKFKLDPVVNEKDLHLTGDLGLMLPDGCLIHKGRKDFRVKVRGYGVELAEVEKCLRNHAKIRDVVVVAGGSDSGEGRLVAYFTCSDQPNPTVSELRVFLKKNLPDYMVPSAFVRLDTIPLTPNGKLDRKALPEPDKLRPQLDTWYAAPRSPTEEQLAEIWSQVLSLDRVGVHDNFFDLGGHSLAATRVVSRVIKQFQLEVSLQSLFQSPTVAEMAAVIAEHQGKKLDKKELNRILTEMESLSEAEASRLVEEARDRK